MQKIGIRLVMAIGILYLKIRARKLEITGRENLPKEGEPFIIVANHVDYGDPPLLWVVTKRAIKFWAKRDLTGIVPLDLLLVLILQGLFGVIPIKRDAPDLSPIRGARTVLTNGHCVGIFPEGTRNTQEVPILQPAFFGAALLARKTGVPIIPIGIQGTRGLLNPFAVLSNIWRPWRLVRTHSITVTIGTPFGLPEKGDLKGRALIMRDVHTILHQIGQQLPEEWRGEYHVTTADSEE